MAAKRVDPLIAIVGETASGKTAVGIELALKIDGEIICADSRTVYQHMDVGTAKPSREDQIKVAHHLIDVVQPDQSFSAAEFKKRAKLCIQDIHKRGKVPIIVGGTGLYVDAVLYDFQFSSKPDQLYRTKLLQMNDEELTTLLHTKNIDTANLNTKNRRHVIRAIERGGSGPINRDLQANTAVFGLSLGRAVLKQRVIDRVEQMFDNGFVKEVQDLANHYGWDNESMSGIGYRVVKDYLEGHATLDEAKLAFVQRDLSLAKRQRTWFKRNKDIRWFEDPNQLLIDAVEFVSDLNYNKGSND